MTLVVMPDPLKLAQDYLATIPAVTALVGTRVRVGATDPTWPSIRITGLAVSEATPRRIDRALIQFDCWAASAWPAQQLARTVRAALREATSYVGATGVITGVDDPGMHSAPDATRDPPIPRWIVTAAVYVRPNP